MAKDKKEKVEEVEEEVPVEEPKPTPKPVKKESDLKVVLTANGPMYRNKDGSLSPKLD